MADTIVEVVEDRTVITVQGADLLLPLMAQAQAAATNAANGASAAEAAQAAAETAAASLAARGDDIDDLQRGTGAQRFTIGTTGTGGQLASAVACYGYVAPYPMRVHDLVASFTASGTGFRSVLRAGRDTTTGKHEAEGRTAITFAANANTWTGVDIDLDTGDVLVIQAATGGYLRQNTGAVSDVGVTFAASPAADGDLIALGSAGAKPTIQMTCSRMEALDATAADIAEATALASQSLTGEEGVIGVGALLGGTITQSIAFAFGPKEPLDRDGPLKQVRFRTRTLSGFVAGLILITREGELVDLRPVTAFTDADGWATVTRAQLGGFPARRGDFVHCFAPDLDSAVSLDTTSGANGSYISKTSFALGDPVTVVTSYANTVLMEVTVEGAISAGSVEARLSAREAAAETARNAARTTLAATKFAGASLPTGWTASGAWTVDDGLTAPASGGWSTFVVLDEHTSLAKRRLMARIVMAGPASQIGICAKPPENSGGAVALIDGSAGYLRFYSWDGTTTPGTYDTQVALPAALVAGRAYLLDVVKDGLATTITLTDTVTQESCSLTETANADYRQWHGQAGILNLSGANVVEWFQMDALYPQKCRVLIIGDSNSEGSYLGAQASWAFLFAEERAEQNDVVLAVRAGDETTNFLTRKAFDLLAWSPRYVILALGTNDTDQATWRTRTAATIAQIEALGAEPIPCTQIPRTASQALRDAMNADVMGGYFGRYRYIDHAAAVSLNHDRSTWDPAYNFGDDTHANIAGQVKMYQQALADCPFLI